MEKLTSNPFKFGDPVEGDYYLPRKGLSNLVRQFLDNHIHVVLMGPRRFGKTSFVLDLFQHLTQEGYSCLLIDIFNVTSHKDFLRQLIRAVRSKETFKDKLKAWWKKTLQSTPQMNVDFDLIQGSAHVGFNLGPLGESDVKNSIQDLLDGLSGLGEKVVIGIDEFQQISQLEDNGWLEATIRTHFQKLANVSFLFTGSRKSLISEMLNNPARPLYRSCQTIEFPSFGPEFTDWIVGRFKRVGIECEPKAIDHLRELVQDTPNYVQMVCFHLVALGLHKISYSDVEAGLHVVCRQNAYAYQALLSSLTLAQQRILRLAANEGRALFHKDMLDKYEISSAPALFSSIKALKSKSILDEEGTGKGKVVFDDPLFAYWLRMTFPI